MTPEERAQKIHLPSYALDEGDRQDILLDIAAQIREAEKEAIDARMVEIFEGDDCCVAALEREMYLKGRTSMREEAAKIAEFHSGPSVHLAERIRAIAAEGR